MKVCFEFNWDENTHKLELHIKVSALRGAFCNLIEVIVINESKEIHLS